MGARGTGRGDRSAARAAWALALTWAWVGPATAAGGGPEAPAYDEFLVVPVRAHVLAAEGLPEVDCGLTDADVRRVFGKVNRIWHPAGIHWDLEAIVREPAARQGEFRARKAERGASALDLYRMLAPPGSKAVPGQHVYYIHRFAVNGVYLGGSTAFVQETARLREVEGGIDEPLPRVTAHELGHALGLPHRQDRTNLLASGTTGTALNAAEVERSRSVAGTKEGTRRVPEIRREAEAAEASDDRARARRLWSTLAEVPGPAAEEAARRRDALGTDPPTPPGG